VATGAVLITRQRCISAKAAKGTFSLANSSHYVLSVVYQSTKKTCSAYLAVVVLLECAESNGRHSVSVIQFQMQRHFTTFMQQLPVHGTLGYCTIELCADELVVGGGVGWSYDRRRRRAAHFSSAAAAWLYGRRRRRRRRQTR